MRFLLGANFDDQADVQLFIIVIQIRKHGVDRTLRTRRHREGLGAGREISERRVHIDNRECDRLGAGIGEPEGQGRSRRHDGLIIDVAEHLIDFLGRVFAASLLERGVGGFWFGSRLTVVIGMAALLMGFLQTYGGTKPAFNLQRTSAKDCGFGKNGLRRLDVLE